jgi:hypothetical protein
MDKIGRIKDKQKEFQGLWARMDKDRDLANQIPFVLKDSRGKAIKNVVNVTTNFAANLANVTIATLLGANMQTVIEGKALSDTKTSQIEEFLDLFYQQKDEELLARLMPSLYQFLVNQCVVRGWMAARYCEGTLLPMDSRYVTFEYGRTGMNWYSYETTRTKYDILDEYETEITKDQVTVNEYWDDKTNDIYVDGELAKSQPNPYGYPPAVILPVPTGFTLMDKGYLERWGESVFFLDRNLFDEWNRIISIEQSLAMLCLKPSVQKPLKNGVTVEAAQAVQQNPPAWGEGGVTLVNEGEEYLSMPRQDIVQASRLAHADIYSAIQQGGLSNIDLGNIQFPLSAVAISDLTEISERVFMPRLQALAMFYQQLSRMAIRQYTEQGETVEVGIAGKKKGVSPSMLEGDYTINYKFLTKSKKQEIANLAIAAGARGILSEDTIRRDVLSLQNPSEEKAKLDSEMAERADPAITMYRLAHSLIDEAERLTGDDSKQKRVEARMVASRGVEMIRQRQMQGTSQEVIEKPENKTAQLMPLLAGAGGGGGRTPSLGQRETD